MHGVTNSDVAGHAGAFTIPKYKSTFKSDLLKAASVSHETMRVFAYEFLSMLPLRMVFLEDVMVPCGTTRPVSCFLWWTCCGEDVRRLHVSIKTLTDGLNQRR